MNYKPAYIRFDWATKHLFSDSNYFPVLEGFLCVLFKEKITIIRTLKNTASDSDLIITLDLLVKNQNNEIFAVKIRNIFEIYFMEQAFGAFKYYNDYRDLDYGEITKVTLLNILFFNFKLGEDIAYYSKNSKMKGLFSDEPLVLTGIYDEVFIQHSIAPVPHEYYLLKAYNIQINNFQPLEQWLYLISTSQIPETFNAQGLQQYKEMLNLYRIDNKMFAVYQNYLDNLRYRASMSYTIKLNTSEILTALD
jgi:hypothetical protein